MTRFKVEDLETTREVIRKMGSKIANLMNSNDSLTDETRSLLNEKLEAIDCVEELTIEELREILK